MIDLVVGVWLEGGQTGMHAVVLLSRILWLERWKTGMHAVVWLSRICMIRALENRYACCGLI